ncbi:hypothetical protein Pint_31832 [Pistacia integerrima]|uniref:Uncharacterized protein n=1 Tax=Pistacia integerrima TaxID=434235 RepID=A0ACC0XL20_9ROSI|nr:hypothetical protein Pint_31832 [Pistacia integerrima]
MGDSSVGSWSVAYRGMSKDNIKGLVLALSSSFFIGASFIVKKKGLKKAAAAGVRAGVGGYSYLYEPLWWVGMITSEFLWFLMNYIAPAVFRKGVWLLVIVGEIANFAAYAFAPAILVTPLGALSIIIRQEKGCRRPYISFYMLNANFHNFLQCCPSTYYFRGDVTHFWDSWLHSMCCWFNNNCSTCSSRARDRVCQGSLGSCNRACFSLVCSSSHGCSFHTNCPFRTRVWANTCHGLYWDLFSSGLTIGVMSVKALGIALKLTFSGMNQLLYPQTWAFVLVVLVCVITQMNYLNKALDTFNTVVVSPIYYVMFTSLTILASVIMFKDWDRQNPTQIVTEMCGFVIILSGTFLLHKTKDLVDGSSATLPIHLPKYSGEDNFESEGIPLRRVDNIRPS